VAWHTLFDELTISPETVGAHGVRPIQWSNLFHHFSCVSPVVAWHTLFDELTISPETVGAQRLAPDSMVKSIPSF
jgi:hypothetical protein